MMDKVDGENVYTTPKCDTKKLCRWPIEGIKLILALPDFYAYVLIIDQLSVRLRKGDAEISKKSGRQQTTKSIMRIRTGRSAPKLYCYADVRWKFVAWEPKHALW